MRCSELHRLLDFGCRDALTWTEVVLLAAILSLVSTLATLRWLFVHRGDGFEVVRPVVLSAAAMLPGAIEAMQLGGTLAHRLAGASDGRSSIDGFASCFGFLWCVVGPLLFLVSGALSARAPSGSRPYGLHALHALTWFVASYVALEVALSI